jgi:RNase adapter protein RapZ
VRGDRRRQPRQAGRRLIAGRFVVVTGLSGSGKSQAIRALEDLGYFCVDNLPVSLIPTMADLSRRAGREMDKVAVVVDVREGRFLEEFPQVYRDLHAGPVKPLLIFLEADDRVLVRRFSETRRPHPLAPNRSAIEGIREERRRMAPIRKMADRIVDTSDMTVHELRQAFMEVSKGRRGTQGLVVNLLSFGFKHGVPVDADMVLDVRFLPNPHFVPDLREHTGREQPVVKYVMKSPATREFLQRATALLKFLIPHYVDEGKTYLTIAIGCTGGRHRSVTIAEFLKRELGAVEGIRLRVKHRDIASE